MIKYMISILVFITTLSGSSALVNTYSKEIGVNKYKAIEYAIKYFENGGKKARVYTRSHTGAIGIYQMVRTQANFLLRTYKVKRKYKRLLRGINSYNWRSSRDKQQRLFLMEIIHIKNKMKRDKIKFTVLNTWVYHNLGNHGGPRLIRANMKSNYLTNLMSKRRYNNYNNKYYKYKRLQRLYKSKANGNYKHKLKRHYRHLSKRYKYKAKIAKNRMRVIELMTRDIRWNLPKRVYKKLTRYNKSRKSKLRSLSKGYYNFWDSYLKRINKHTKYKLV